MLRKDTWFQAKRTLWKNLRSHSMDLSVNIGLFNNCSNACGDMSRYVLLHSRSISELFQPRQMQKFHQDLNHAI